MSILIPTLLDSSEDYVTNMLERSNILLRNDGEGGGKMKEEKEEKVKEG